MNQFKLGSKLFAEAVRDGYGWVNDTLDTRLWLTLTNIPCKVPVNEIQLILGEYK
jgi:hypothetical protein